MWLLLRCVGIDKKETKGGNNISVVKINTSLDAGRVRIRRCTHSQLQCRKFYVVGLLLGSFAGSASKQSQLCLSFAFYVISFSILFFSCPVGFSNLKLGMEEPAGTVRLPLKLAKWLTRQGGQRAVGAGGVAKKG